VVCDSIFCHSLSLPLSSCCFLLCSFLFLKCFVSCFGLLCVSQSSLLLTLGSFVFFNFCLFFILGSLVFNLLLSFAMGSFVSWSLGCMSFLAHKFHDHFFCFLFLTPLFHDYFSLYYNLVICFVILACEAHKCKSCKFFSSCICHDCASLSINSLCNTWTFIPPLSTITF
jgi:hypothetical protein